MKQFAEGDKVMVIGPPGAVVCEVFHAASPDQMPDLGPGSLSKEAVEVMREMHVDLMLLLGHDAELRRLAPTGAVLWQNAFATKEDERGLADLAKKREPKRTARDAGG